VEGERGKKKDEEGGGWKRIRERINRISPLLFLLLHKDIEKKENDDDEEEDRKNVFSFFFYISFTDGHWTPKNTENSEEDDEHWEEVKDSSRDWWSFRRN